MKTHALMGILFGCFLYGCATRPNPDTAVTDAERDIAAGKIGFCYVGGFAPFAPGVPEGEDAFGILSRYERIAIGPQGCVQDEYFPILAAYARRYNERMWRYVYSERR